MDEKELRRHLEECYRTGCTHMLLCVDRRDGGFDDFAVKVHKHEDVEKEVDKWRRSNIEVVEVYNMSMGLDDQLNDGVNVFNL